MQKSAITLVLHSSITTMLHSLIAIMLQVLLYSSHTERAVSNASTIICSGTNNLLSIKC